MATPKTVKANPRERTIELEVRLWTNSIDGAEKGFIVPKHGWTRGTIGMRRNDSHGILPKNPRPFNSLMELPAVFEKVLIEHGITLHCESKMAKYIQE
jgi:hypothetical protein